MVDVYQRVRGGIETIRDSSSTTEELKQAAKEVKELGTVDASFSRGQLYLLEEEVVFAQSINESTIGNFLDNFFSKGPINPLQTLGIYKPYESSLEDADQYAGSWRLPYSEIEAVSLLSKANGYEVFLRPTGDDEHLYRIRNDKGNDYIGFRWLHSPNHDTAVQIASEIFDQANRYGRVEEFNAGGHFPVRTKQVEFNKGESKHAGKEPVEQSTSSTETSSSNKSKQEVEPADSNVATDISEDENGEEEVPDSDIGDQSTSKENTVEQTSQSRTAEDSPESQSVNDNTQNSTSAQTTSQPDTSTTSKRRWSILLVGILLMITLPVVGSRFDTLLFTTGWFGPFLTGAGSIGILTILFGTYRVIRY